MSSFDDFADKTVSDEFVSGSFHDYNDITPGLLYLSGSHGGRRVHLSPGRWIIGRSIDASISFPHESVSRSHCEVIVDEHLQVSIRDLGSLNGTQINGVPLASGEMATLEKGDQIRLSAFAHLKFFRQSRREAALHEELVQAAVNDPLTGLLNRRELDTRLAQDFAYARRHGPHLVLVVMDIDYFKAVNDTYGHDVGDIVLKATANRIRELVRSEDLVARFGGEEFVIVMRGAHPTEVVQYAERIRSRVQSTSVKVPSGVIHITLSGGVAHAAEATVTSAEDLFALADRRLYEAKRNGRNRIVGPAVVRGVSS